MPLSAPQRALEKLGLRRPIDLALHLPLRYEDETNIVPIAALRQGQTAQVQGVVEHSEIDLRGRRQWVVSLSDGSAILVLRFLTFYASHQKTMQPGQRLRVRGEVRHGFWGPEMVHPSFKAVQADTPLASTLTPIYPTTSTLPQAYLRKAVAGGLARADLSELIPKDLLPAGLMGLREALQVLHQPGPQVSLAALQARSHPAWERLKFEELVAQQLSQLQAKQTRALQEAAAFESLAGGWPEQLLAQLPFALTAAQSRVVQEIAQDLSQPVPMHRLLQGDVGSGKTVVAALAAMQIMQHGWQCALMVPTEILAEQHFKKMMAWLAPFEVKTAWLTGRRKGKARQQALAHIASGQVQLVVGTHAVIQNDVHFAKLGLVLIDEQHRFGVAQRLALRQKSAHRPLEPHLLMMSATPIPRTLAQTLFADLDVSTIDELPPGRQAIVTRVFSQTKRNEVMATLAQEAARGRQIYWVCPLIEESETLDLQNATATHQALSAALPGLHVQLLHGRMSSTEKAHIMAQFSSGQSHVLVSTTVIEVGVDVPNASLMVIEHAERFGLSQLHQLRGRVGRGSAHSVCVLLYSHPLSSIAKSRLKAMLETNDGFEIARRDLHIRGPGEFLGERQSGAALLRFADMVLDTALVERARTCAIELLAQHPSIAQQHVQRWVGDKAQYLQA